MPDLDRLDRVFEAFPESAGESRGRKRGLFGRRNRGEDAVWGADADDPSVGDLGPVRSRGRDSRRGQDDEANDPRGGDPGPARSRGRDGRRGDDADPRSRGRSAGPGEQPGGDGRRSASPAAYPPGPADAEQTAPPRRRRGQDAPPPGPSAGPRGSRTQPGDTSSAAGPRSPLGDPGAAAPRGSRLVPPAGPAGRGDPGRAADTAAYSGPAIGSHSGPLTGPRGDLGRPGAPAGPGRMAPPAELGRAVPRGDPGRAGAPGGPSPAEPGRGGARDNLRSSGPERQPGSRRGPGRRHGAAPDASEAAVPAAEQGRSLGGLRGRRHRPTAQPAPDGAVPERAATPWAAEPGGDRRRPAEPGAGAQSHTNPQLRYQSTVQMEPGPGATTGTGPLGSIRTYQPGTGPQVAQDDPAGFWAGTGPQSSVDTGTRRAPADPRPADRRSADRPTSDRSTAARTVADRTVAEPDTDRRGRKRRSAGPDVAHPSVDRNVREADTDLGQPAERAARSAKPKQADRRPARRRSRRMIMVAAGLAAVVAAAGVADVLGVFGSKGPAHVLVAPDRLGAYVRRPQLEKQASVSALRREVIAKSAGQASHVVSAVYEDSAGSSPQMILFIAGNLSGVSAGDFISSFTQQSKGAFVTSPGTLGGSAACVNAQASVPGSVALCTWADNDTFGVVASLTMNATKLAAEMRVLRPMVERLAK